MSLNRFVYYCAVTGGWAALLAWLVAEWVFFRPDALGAGLPGIVRDTLTAAILGGVLGVGLWVVSGMTNARWAQLFKRARLGLLGGALGGGLGGFFGAVLYWLYAPRAIGWLIMGMGIGATEGLYERSRRKTRNGLIGGTIGGLLGGLLFGWIAQTRLEMSGRATAFVILGLCVGALIGLAHVVLKEAWLTVLDGYRPGRQFILSKDTTALGRAEHLALPFLGHADSEIEPEHARVTRQPNGQFLVEDNQTRIGTLVNSQPIHGPLVLRDGDLIKLGTNIVRFNHRRRGPRRGDSPSGGTDLGRNSPSSGAGSGRGMPITPPPLPPVAFGSPLSASPASAPPLSPVSGAPENSGSGDPGSQSPDAAAWTPGAGPMRPPPPPK
jgi:pSer/pThr/pTyr-binding forkhead associated (FHA) protein